MSRRPIAPLSMWAVVIMQPRSHWLNHATIAATRKAAADAYIGFWLPEYQGLQRRQRNKTWRTVRVTVTPTEWTSK